MFHAGQQVECIDDSPDWAGRPMVVKKGKVYTVASVFESFGIVSITLVGVDPGGAPGWVAHRFRPLTKRTTDISVFKALLNPANHDQTEKA